MSKFGVYIHIPYCLQRCTYCDFATYVHTEIRPPEEYVALVKKEISQKQHLFQPVLLDTLYFGGGTPSLVDAELIVDLINELAKFGYLTGPKTEITIEINPATVDQKKLDIYLKAGINRFSVGAQSFSDRLLKMVNREHNAEQTKQTLKLLKSHQLNFSFDLLFALPTQTIDELQTDIEIALDLGAKHISPYCLTVPEGHPLSKNRPIDDEQIEMFDLIHKNLVSNNFNRYEISNYSLLGYESRHNLLYWTDEPYWGLGLSAHSYSKNSEWGTRFWNPNSLDVYSKQIEKTLPPSDSQSETLEFHQSLTDFCHTSLRLSSGLSIKKINSKFGINAKNSVEKIAISLIEHNLMHSTGGHYVLADKGIYVSNQIFEKFTFLKDEF